MKEYVIQPKVEGKGRSFSATCVALVTAYGLFSSGNDGKTIRPVWSLWAGSDSALRSFMANLKVGRKAEPVGHNSKGDSDRVEFLRSVGFLSSWQREEEGSLATLYHPDLFRLDPGLVDPAGINFILLVPSDWAKAQSVEVTPAVRHVQQLSPKVDPTLLARLVPTAYLFAAYLDRRTRCPLVADGRFYLQLLVAALESGMASLPGTNIRHSSSYGYDQWGRHAHHSFDIEIGGQYPHGELGDIGLEHAISVTTGHASFEQFLAEQVTLFFECAGRKRFRTAQVDVSRFMVEG